MRVPVCPECREIHIAIKPGMEKSGVLSTMTLTSVAAASVNFLANFHRKETKHDERLSTTT